MVCAIKALPSKLKDEYRLVDLDDASLTGYRLSGLQPDTLYLITVCAATRVGCGPASYVEIRTPSAGRKLNRAQMND